jgi:hypothetical protein
MPETGTFDLLKLDTRAKSEAGVDMVLRYPPGPNGGAPIKDSAGMPVTIKLKGVNSDAFRAAKREMEQRAVERRARSITPNEAELDIDTQDYLCSITIGWSDNLTLGGEAFPPTPENIRKLWADQRWSWVSKQVESFVLAEGNFLAN